MSDHLLLPRIAFVVVAALATHTALAQQTPLEIECTRALTYPGYSGEQSIRACTRIIDDRSTSTERRVRMLNWRAIHAAQIGDYRRCVEDITEFLRFATMPRDQLAAIIGLRGSCRVQLGQLDLALADYDQALQLDPLERNNPSQYSMRGIIYERLRDFDRAIENFDKALHLDPRNVDLMIVRGNAYMAKDDYDRAFADYEAAIRARPGHGVAIGNRGIVHLKKGNYEQAIADISYALRTSAGWPYLRVALREAQDAKAALSRRRPPDAPLRPSLTNRIALVLGNGTYENISRLANAESDAIDIGQALISMGYQLFGYPRTNFTRAQMLAEIGAFRRAAVDADTALIWYAGHGQEFVGKDELGRNWLIPTDARIERTTDVYGHGVPLSDLINSAMPARTLRIVVIDACRNSTLPSATRAIGPRLAIEQRSGMMIVFSTRSGTVALDGEGRNSPFAAAFLEVARDKSRLDVRQFFGAVSAGTLARTRNAQEPELIVRLQTDALLPLMP